MLKNSLNLKNNLLGNSLKVLSLRILGIIVFFGLSLFLTNNFSANLVGRYDFARSLLLIIGGISLLGTNQSVIYYSGFLKANNSLASLKKVYFKMISIIFMIAVFFLILLFLIEDSVINSFFDKPDAYNILCRVILVLSIYAWGMLNIDMFRALGKTILSEVFRNVVRYLPFLIIAVVLIYKNLGEFLIEAYLLSFAVLWLTSTIGVFVLIGKLSPVKNTTIISYKNIILKSYPMAISAISYFMMQSIDIILLSKFDTYENVAYYSVAVKLATTSALALLSINVVIAPRIAEIYTQNDKEKLKALIKNSSRLIFFMSLIAIFVLVVLSNFILKLFGPMYTEAKYALLILLVGQLFNSFCGPVGVYMNMTGKQNVLHKILILGLAINIILNLILIPQYGMNGAAFATAISMISWNALATGYVFKKDHVKTFLS